MTLPFLGGKRGSTVVLEILRFILTRLGILYRWHTKRLQVSFRIIFK